MPKLLDEMARSIFCSQANFQGKQIFLKIPPPSLDSPHALGSLIFSKVRALTYRCGVRQQQRRRCARQ